MWFSRLYTKLYLYNSCYSSLYRNHRTAAVFNPSVHLLALSVCHYIYVDNFNNVLCEQSSTIINVLRGQKENQTI